MKITENTLAILHQVEKIPVLPASVIFTEEMLDELAMRNDITWGDAEHTLIHPRRLVEIDTDDETGKILTTLADLNIYIDLEN